MLPVFALTLYIYHSRSPTSYVNSLSCIPLSQVNGGGGGGGVQPNLGQPSVNPRSVVARATSVFKPLCMQGEQRPLATLAPKDWPQTRAVFASCLLRPTAQWLLLLLQQQDVALQGGGSSLRGQHASAQHSPSEQSSRRCRGVCSRRDPCCSYTHKLNR